MTKLPPQRNAAQRRDVCRQHGRWPEVGVKRVEDTGGIVYLHLTCGHTTARLKRTKRPAVITCDQCAEGAPV